MNNSSKRWVSICVIVLIIVMVPFIYFNPSDIELFINRIDLNLVHRIVVIMLLLLFFGVGYYILRAIYCNCVLKPQKVTLYLKSKKD